MQAFTPAQGSLKTLFPTKRTACQQAVGTRAAFQAAEPLPPRLGSLNPKMERRRLIAKNGNIARKIPIAQSLHVFRLPQTIIQGSLKIARRRLAAKWCTQQDFAGWQNIDEPPTRHRASRFRLPQQRNPPKAARKTKTAWYCAKRFFVR